MIKTPTYKEQFDKLTRAYIEDRVNPMKGCACFIGNLLNERGDWEGGRSASMLLSGEQDAVKLLNTNSSLIVKVVMEEANGLYTPLEIVQMEILFVRTFKKGKETEVALFMAFKKTLDLLKQIHQSKGEVIDETPKFTKRELQKENSKKKLYKL